MTTYITSTGSFLPGPPISNDEIARYLGPLDKKQDLIRRNALKKNGIKTRYFALAADGLPRFTNARMAANACLSALRNSETDDHSVGFLSAAASQGDVMAPGFASMVHGELGLPPCEISSIQSFCAGGVMALRAAFHALATSGDGVALACTSEFASRFLRHGYLSGAEPSLSSEFLRWGLSDGAGAFVLQNRPNRYGLSLRIEFIDLVSYANQFDTCMVGGTNLRSDGSIGLPWSNYATIPDAIGDGVFHLQQDFERLKEIVPLGLKRYLELVDSNRINPDQIDWLLCHFSSKIFHDGMLEAARKMEIRIPADGLFTNLYDKGNTGSAAIYIMLDELFRQKRPKPGEKILCMIPESGRFVVSFMLLTVCGPENEEHVPSVSSSTWEVPTKGGNQKLKQKLARIWFDFEVSLQTVPIVQRVERGGLQLADYRLILKNMRQQVVEGARWITRAASNMSSPALDLRSLFIGHAQEEHRDYELLEKDFVAAGGILEEIKNGEKNIGSEALSAWMFHKASQENPIDLLGAMFIIEGVGNRLAGKWATSIKRQLNLSDKQVSFLTHHGTIDESHITKLWGALESDLLTEDISDRIIKVAKVTARLYRLQLEELDYV